MATAGYITRNTILSGLILSKCHFPVSAIQRTLQPEDGVVGDDDGIVAADAVVLNVRKLWVRPVVVVIQRIRFVAAVRNE